MILEIIILILAIPAGYLIAYWARDELVQGKKWFKALIILATLAGIWSYLIGEEAIVWTAGFILISTFVSVFKAEDKKFVDKKFK